MRIPWKKSIIEVLSDVLRFAVWAGLVIGVIAMSLFVAWFAGEFFWHLGEWCKRVPFGQPW